MPTTTARTAPARALAAGHRRRAFALLAGVHLLAVAGAWLIWLIGLAPVFDERRWIPNVAVIGYGVVVVLGLMFRYGFWTPQGSGYGEDYGQVGGWWWGGLLGWWRWLLQLLLIGGIVAAGVVIGTNGRWWHLFGTAEIDAMPALVARLPIPADWEETSRTVGDDRDSRVPNQRYSLDYVVPADYTLSDLEAWLRSAEWTAPGDGSAAFGALRSVTCTTTTERCEAQVTPPAGRPVEYTLDTSLWASDGGATTRVSVDLRYLQATPVEREVSDAVVARASSVPVPPDWIEVDSQDRVAEDGQSLERTYVVPAPLSLAGLRAYLASPAWTAPGASGTAFGAVEVQDCRTDRTGGATELTCWAGVTSSLGEDGFFTELIEVDHDPAALTVEVEYRDAPR
ncbi:hypothetical protein [Nocardioides sp.]|uniref:hypothetical protein n=1 Tax=Nocardioides sp. TaxID=35761 RepID=UPI0035192A56